MMKKMFVLAMALILTMGLMVGCGASEGDKKKTNEFLGKFTGEVGSLTFSSRGEVLVNFSDAAAKILKGKPNNKTYRYAFQTGKEVLPYEEANGIFLYESENDTLAFTYIGYRGEKDKITFYPGGMYETVLQRVKN